VEVRGWSEDAKPLKNWSGDKPCNEGDKNGEVQKHHNGSAGTPELQKHFKKEHRHAKGTRERKK
jgi:hypothetical protein